MSFSFGSSKTCVDNMCGQDDDMSSIDAASKDMPCCHELSCSPCTDVIHRYDRQRSSSKRLPARSDTQRPDSCSPRESEWLDSSPHMHWQHQRSKQASQEQEDLLQDHALQGSHPKSQQHVVLEELVQEPHTTSLGDPSQQVAGQQAPAEGWFFLCR
jgi:hypothetical protein